MIDKENIISEIVHANLQTIYNMLEPIKDDNEEIKEAFKKFKYGINIKYHIEWNLKGHCEVRERQRIVVMNGKEYDLETWWDEEEERRGIGRSALMEFYGKEETPYDVR